MPIPKIVNRGPAGLHNKLTEEQRRLLHEHNQKENKEFDVYSYPKDRIAESLLGCVVPIDSINYDPMNTCVHPKRNMQIIKESLAYYGQMKPLVVKSDGMIVVAGNGTLQAARELGWTKIAITLHDLNAITAAGYGIVDNRSTDHRQYNIEMLKRVITFIEEQAAVPTGHSSDELEVLRAGNWVPPPVNGGPDDIRKWRKLKFSPDQVVALEWAISELKGINNECDKLSDEECIIFILNDWLQRK